VRLFWRRKNITRLSVTARCDFDIPDEEVFLSYVRRRLATDRGYTPEDVAEHTRDIEQAMSMLFEMDDWTADYEKEGAEFGAGACSVDRIGISSDGATRLSVAARWDFYIRKEEAFLAYVRKRLAAEAADAPDSVAERTRNSEAAMMALFDLDGWSADYPKEVLSLSGKEVKVKPVEATLDEADDDERAEPES
jgi:hypothetical protein